MGNVILTHDAGVEAFDQASGVVDSNDDNVSFSWDEQHIVRVDAPADLKGAFDTDKFYKIADATIARPIKQKYRVGDSIKTYKKPAEELQKAAWSFDNSPYTIDHPSTGMVKDIDDVEAFWRNARYDNDSERLLADLYVPVTNDKALNYIEENQDVSVGFYNRVYSEYDGDTGDLTDDDVDGFQVDIFGNHVAGVEQGRCSAENGCGLDSGEYGSVVVNSSELTIERFSDGKSKVMELSQDAQIASQSVSIDEGDMDLSIPESAQQAAQSFLDAVDGGKVPESCGGPDGTGRRRAGMFAEGGELSLETWVTGGTDAVANWHPRHEGNEEYDESEVDTPWEDCGYAMFKAWGGETARNKAARLKEQVESQDATTIFEGEQTMKHAYTEGDMVRWMADARVAHNPDEKGVMIEIMDRNGNSTEMVTTVDPEKLRMAQMTDAEDTYNEGTTVTWQGGDAKGEIIDYKSDGCYSDRIDGDFEICAGDSVVYLIEEDDGKTVAHKHDTLTVSSTDAEGTAPMGIYEASDGTWFAVAPDEHPDDNTSHVDDAKFNVDTCSDVSDAWKMRGSGDISIDESTLEDRILRVAEMMDCDMPDTATEQMDGELTTTKNTEDNTMSETFEIPDLSVDALAEKHEAVGTLVEQNDSLKSTLNEIETAFDEAEHIALDDGECVCDAVDDLVDELDEKATEVEDLTDELKEYRQEEIDEKLDELTELGADREEWEDQSLDAIEEELDRREEVLDAAPQTSVKDVDDGGTETNTDSTSRGSREFGRGYGA
jgi:hypothetical protein